MKVAILETGAPAQPLQSKFGGYFEMFCAAFKEINSSAQFTNFPVYLDSKFPDLEEFQGYIISGSPFGVYEDHAFIEPLSVFIRESINSGVPIVGICFGHQLMAEAMGGRVEKSSKGWGVGMHNYTISRLQAGSEGGPATALFLDSDHESLSCLVSHQDQVVGLSPEITQIGGSSFCPNGILSYGAGNGLSFQMHPEFTNEFASALLESRLDRIDIDCAAKARDSFAHISNRFEILKKIQAFFDIYAK